MNTREREEILKVMDALANALRRSMDVEFGLLCDSALAAYDCLTTDEHDALLAEGSASSEGAEAVAPVPCVIVDKEGVILVRKGTEDEVCRGRGGQRLYTHPQPAQGEQCSALEVFRIAGGDVECTPNPTAVVAMDCLRDLRQCYDEELSKPERRPIADEVVGALDRMDALLDPSRELLSVPYTSATYAGSLNDMRIIRAALESALPRGLPAGSDAKPIDMLLFCPECGEQHVDAPEEYERDEGLSVRMDVHWTNPPHRSHLCHACECIWRPSDVATNGVAKIATRGKADTWDAIAEQPSCGQDADMAALDWIEAMHTLHGSVEFLYVVDGYEVRITKDDGNSWTLLGSGPTLRDAIKEAIAAQQRQGEHT